MLESLSPPRTFLGVHFALFGFDLDTHCRVRAKLLSGGGVDAGGYGPNCTHVIVDKIVYDDPLCVAARNDQKTVVTGLWVDHSYDIGMTADTTLVMYRPLRDLNGIPGAESLIMCLTGYQRQDREDIMTMVAFMGAQFSKPLVAHKVTHLICYKFEGEKYELANKMKKIKLVNHKWLEDCLRDWEILPETNYNKSSYELEMDAEARDSEDEDEHVDHLRKSVINRSPSNVKVGIGSPSLLPKSSGDSSKEFTNKTGALELSNVVGAMDLETTPIRGNREPSKLDDVTVLQNLGGPDMESLKGVNDAVLNKECEKTPMSENIPKDPMAFRNSDGSRLDGKFNSVSYSRKRTQKTPLSIHTGDKACRINCLTEVAGAANKSSPKEEQSKHEMGSASVQNPCIASDGNGLGSTYALQQGRKLGASFAGSKSLKMSGLAAPCMSSVLSESNRVQGSKSKDLMDQSLGEKEPIKESAIEKGTPYASTSKSTSLNGTPSASCPQNADSMTGKGDYSDKDAVQASSGVSRQASLENRHHIGETDLSVHAQQFGEIRNEQIQLRALENLSSRDQDKEIGASFKLGNFDLLDKAGDKVTANPTRKTLATKKTLGSRTKLCKSTNLKGSIFSSKDDFCNKSLSSVNDREEMGISDNALICSNMAEGSLPHGNVEAALEVKNHEKTVSDNLDDETEAPEDDFTLEKGTDQENKSIDQLETAFADAEEAHFQDVPNISHSNEDNARTPKEGSSNHGLKLIGDDIDPESREKEQGRNLKAKSSKGMKILGKKKQKVLAAKVIVEYAGTTGGEPASIDHTEGKMGKQKMSQSKGKAKINAVKANKLENTGEAEKENKPVTYSVHGQIPGKLLAQNSLAMSDGKEKKVDTEKMKSKSKVARTEHTGTKEPAWFIFKGDKQQRKKFQQLIRHLKGRYCRDSHQWSYQATHFIAPGPLRRTEKFFAAAASGRWILKPDYLSACSEAGKFLDEEPYEWHENGLSEDGAINLGAPRKWRLLAERTGHGAFYDMRIIVYGECIAPPLDTLKRAVKAGGGIILATSPPYSRFLNSVDFAVVSPGMPRVDIWIQEFLKHEIPCVVADYLVEYVCKPGYALDRHVLYNTHPWAEKSFARLQKKGEEILVPSSPDNDDDGDDEDLACQVCSSTNRGEVMLICGDENGSTGCGICYHIDCLNPPLEAVPEGDWFCPICSVTPNKSNSSGKKRRRRSSSFKRSQ